MSWVRLLELWIVAGALFGGGICFGSLLASRRWEALFEEAARRADQALHDVAQNALEEGQRIGEITLRRRQLQAGAEPTPAERHVAAQRAAARQGLQ